MLYLQWTTDREKTEVCHPATEAIKWLMNSDVIQ